MTRRDPTKPLTEAEWQRIVLRIARQFGWRSYHTLNSWGSAKGFPDLVLVRPPRLVFAELKSDKGVVKPEQEAWLTELGASGADTYVWRPEDYEEVVRALSPAPVSGEQGVRRA